MKKLVLSFLIVAIPFIANCQNNKAIEALIPGYKQNDTIKIDDFLKIEKLSTNNKDYTIKSFTLIFMDRGFLKEFASTSNKITDEMRNAISSLKDKNIRNVKLYFDNVIIVTPQGKSVMVGSLIYKLKIK